MKIKFLWILMFVFFLTGCTSVSADYLIFTLNPGNDTVEINTTFVDQKATAKYGLINLEVVVISNHVDVTKKGVYDVVYQTTYRELVQTLVRKVTVVDETPPVLSLKPGIDTLTVGQTWIDAGIDYSDNSFEEVEIVVIGEVLNQVGRYEITYQATDTSGNTSKLTRIVYVIE